MPLPRLRQLVLAACALEPTVVELQALLGAQPPYRDPVVGQFGLVNAVLNVGSSFVEVVSPTAADTAAGRWIERHGGDGGYMLMLEVDDISTARDRLGALGVRLVWDLALDDVTDLHLHPKDTGGCLLALDAVTPPGSWRWGGPQWTGQAPQRAGGLREVTIAAADPDATAARWREVIGLPAYDGPVVALGEGTVRFVPEGHGIVAATLALPGAQQRSKTPRTETVAGVQLTLEDA